MYYNPQQQQPPAYLASLITGFFIGFVLGILVVIAILASNSTQSRPANNQQPQQSQSQSPRQGSYPQGF